MRRITALAGAMTLALGLAACSTSDSSSTPTDSAASVSESAQATETTGTAGTEMPSLDTSGANPVLAFPDSNPVDGLQAETVEEGTGRIVEETDYVVANYVGQVWGNSTPFDSSFERGAATGFSLQNVIQGWTQGLSGLPVGSKVILSIPSDLGYPDGNTGAGIEKGDTIAFYVEIVDAYGMNQAGQADATVEVEPDQLPVTIEGALGEPTSVTINSGEQAPTEPSSTVIATGSGDPVGGAGTTVYVQYSAAFWDSEISESTYGTLGPQAPVIGNGTLFDALEGVPVGSRVLVLVPATEAGDTATSNTAPAFAAVVDILGQMPADAGSGAGSATPGEPTDSPS